jgi:vacuolar protein sorting-associated protein 45
MGVTNIFTQHKPLLENVFQLIFEHKLPLQDFPYAGGQPKDRPTEVIVFIVGGATYEEAAHVAKLNLGNERASTYLLGGTTIHSSYSYALSCSESLNPDLILGFWFPRFLQDLQEFRDILSGGR